MLGRGVEGRCAQECQCVRGIAARPDMNLQFAGLEIRKTRIGRLYGCAADAAGKQMRSQSFVAKLRVGSKIFRARPPLAVVQRHSVEGTARQKQTAAVAKRKMPYRSPQHDI